MGTYMIYMIGGAVCPWRQLRSRGGGGGGGGEEGGGGEVCA